MANKGEEPPPAYGAPPQAPNPVYSAGSPGPNQQNQQGFHPPGQQGFYPQGQQGFYPPGQQNYYQQPPPPQGYYQPGPQMGYYNQQQPGPYQADRGAVSAGAGLCSPGEAAKEAWTDGGFAGWSGVLLLLGASLLSWAGEVSGTRNGTHELENLCKCDPAADYGVLITRVFPRKGVSELKMMVAVRLFGGNTLL
ncbi:Uncharacterized protein TCAP_02472 [Tolypocladium capitatum]|uniref:Uncharacterized protein n=1 Tax=Tolypocladium capitatum TaxID=45235 RepID=A0A2K3QJ93_9HYPO|nr:Uncharacterized protein TCAP_02472 [Tolypocladium capitatum]